jgi:uncharacterized protein with beta-barrel porin domain
MVLQLSGLAIHTAYPARRYREVLELQCGSLQVCVPSAFAAGCGISDISNSLGTGPISNAAAINCINVQNSTVNGSVANTGAGTITASGATPPTNAGITINNSVISGSISNGGHITANNTGILISNNASVGGGISNSGVISAGNNPAIFLNTVSTFAGGITNSGTVTSGNLGIILNPVSTFSGGIVNAASGKVTAALSDIGIFNFATFSGGVTNSGTLTSTGEFGIEVSSGSTFSGGVTNHGSISAKESGIHIVGISQFAGGVTNTGTITSATRIGIHVSGINQFGSSAGGGISNSGTITASLQGVVVSNISTFDGGVANSGAVTARTGILVQTIGQFNGGISNGAGGTITAAKTGIAVGLNSTVSTFSGGITNAGAIAGHVGILVGGTTAAGGKVSVFSGGIANSGSISGGFSGISVNHVSNFAGGISNSGVISATTNVALMLSNVSTFAGGITNSGTVTSGNLGIRIEPVSTFSGGIVNAASGKVTAALSDIGIFNFANFSGGVTNSGTLTSTIGVGIEVNNGSTFSGGVTNNGSISAKGTGINIAGISQFAGGVTNTGTITSATRIGIHVSGINQFGSSAGGGISNTGVISGKTGIVLGSGVSTFSGVIFNSGTIAGTGGTAIDVHNANNAITIDQAGGLISGNILLSTNADVVNVTGGAINGNILGRGVSDTLNFSLGAGTFTYGAAHGFIGINAVNVNSGMVILDGENNATATTVNGGNLQIGDAANPGALLTSTVNVDGGTLSGHGTILGAVTVNNGGTLAPGGSIGTLTINGSLVFNAGSAYAIQVSDTMASKTLVTGTPGTATINGGAVVAAPQFALGSHGGVTFTILTAAGGRTGTFPALTADAPNFTGTFSLNYDANDVFLNVGKGFEILPQPPGGTINQKEVVAGINHAILGGATVPANFQTLAGLSGTSYLNALTQLSGEVTTGAQAAAFQLGDQFLNLMLNPFVNGRGYAPTGAGAGPLGFAGDAQVSPPSDVARAYASIFTKAPPPATFDQRWSVWSAGYGGVSTTSGDPVVGSSKLSASAYGYAAGMDYRLSANSVVGIALAGGGTSWNVANALGSGRSDAIQAGAYGVSWYGPAYIGAAFAFANHWFTTDRVALSDQLTANFNGQTYSARLEGGYRFAVLPTFGVTPYAALEAQAFHSPSYLETDVTGVGFGLAYNAANASDVRTEIGARLDAPTLANGKPLIFYGRLAWAHDFAGTPAIGAAFETLPGSGFTVFGAPIAHDSALTTAGAQLFLSPHLSLIAKFDGQFAPGMQSYAGTGTLRYAW